jgi:hypothetical protein
MLIPFCAEMAGFEMPWLSLDQGDTPDAKQPDGIS